MSRVGFWIPRILQVKCKLFPENLPIFFFFFFQNNTLVKWINYLYYKWLLKAKTWYIVTLESRKNDAKVQSLLQRLSLSPNVIVTVEWQNLWEQLKDGDFTNLLSRVILRKELTDRNYLLLFIFVILFRVSLYQQSSPNFKWRKAYWTFI